ncbi:hypothetical protein CC1G_01008 [Coprinopsis cinerea okayama7|uniref:Uncharacterized protein n=1 Tax=Coprinopsis cinerea (strain Okayama-7 / 130 / ATCC MYA-4618 / FGSC 9003) TaxID=240176 RepID=A8NE67_COPC7|nr:hypothetical protein CC1G_01008 [Coprinopsis cinerea okayama7\|eukprot:XP_001832946.2 hypothetical protein CC1G_01008 [Coprinopsis cinerea okayama7\
MFIIPSLYGHKNNQVYRCTVVFCGVPVVYVTVIGMLCGSIISWAVSAAQVFSQDNWANLGYDVVTEFEGIGISVFCSVMINLTVTLAISTKVIRARRALENLRIDTPSPHDTVIAILMEAAVPSALLGLAVFLSLRSLFRGKRDKFSTHWLRVLWLSVTAFAPHIMLLRVVEGRSWSGHDSRVSRPLAFIESNSTGVDTAQEDGTRV